MQRVACIFVCFALAAAGPFLPSSGDRAAAGLDPWVILIAALVAAFATLAGIERYQPKRRLDQR